MKPANEGEQELSDDEDDDDESAGEAASADPQVFVGDLR